MFKHTILALASLTTLGLAAVPATTGAALAQQRLPCAAQCPPTDSGSTFKCTDQLGFLRRVYEEEIAGIDNPNDVSIAPICVGESYGVFRNSGNAGALRTTIADNDAMSEALYRKDFGSDDVVGVRVIGDNKVILYVHPFHH